MQSQTFQTTWTVASSGTALTITANALNAPDGTTTAEQLTNTATTLLHRLSQPVAAVRVSTQYAISFFAKNNNAGFIAVSLYDDTSFTRNAAASFNLSTGAVGTTSASGTGYSVDSTSITETPAGSGWYRCTAVVTVGSTCTAPSITFAVQTASTLGGNYGLGSAYLGAGESIYLWGAQLEQRSAVTAYTATTTQPITNYVPVLLTAASGVARFEHNPTTGESLGLEIEESRTNLVTYSEQFDNAAWGKFNATVTANTVVAPDGALTGDKLFENSASGVEHYIEQTISTTTNQAYTQSVYVKAAETASFRMVVVAVGSLTATVSDAIFTISSGVISYSSGSGLISYGSATHVGNGWYRCTVTYTLNGTVTSHRMRIYPRISGIYTGNGFSGIYIWGAQLEAGAFATSYIPTVASQVTRAADAASMTGTNFSSWYNQAEGTLFAEAAAPLWSANAVASAPALASINDGAANNRIYLGRSAASTRPFFNVGVAGVTQADITTSLTSWAGGSAMKLAGAYKVNDFAICTDGGAAGTDTVGTLPVVTQLLIGSRGDGPIWNSTIKKLAYYPALVTNAQSQALTS